MKYQALFSSKDNSKKLKYHLLQFFFGALRVKTEINKYHHSVMMLKQVFLGWSHLCMSYCP